MYPPPDAKVVLHGVFRPAAPLGTRYWRRPPPVTAPPHVPLTFGIADVCDGDAPDVAVWRSNLRNNMTRAYDARQLVRWVFGAPDVDDNILERVHQMDDDAARQVVLSAQLDARSPDNCAGNVAG